MIVHLKTLVGFLLCTSGRQTVSTNILSRVPNTDRRYSSCSITFFFIFIESYYKGYGLEFSKVVFTSGKSFGILGRLILFEAELFHVLQFLSSLSPGNTCS